MSVGVLPPAQGTPPGRLVFVPADGRDVVPPAPWLIAPWLVDQVRGQAAWILVPCLVSLRAEFNTLSPARDKASDGSVGDTAHAASSSDHNPDESGVTPYEDSDNINEVHAIDVDASGPWPAGLSMRVIVEHVAAEHRAGRDDRLQYIIYQGQIISRSWGWREWRPYTGVNPHDKHAHFSSRYTTAQESDTSTWGVATLGRDDLVTTQTEFNTLMAAALKNAGIRQLIGGAVIDTVYGNTARPGRTIQDLDRDLHQLRDVLVGDADGAAAIPLPETAPVLRLVALPEVVAALGQAIGKIAENVTTDDQELQNIRDAIEATRLGNPGQSVDQVVSALRSLLGDRAAEIGALLAQTSATGRR